MYSRAWHALEVATRKSDPQDYTGHPQTPIPLERAQSAPSSRARVRRAHARRREKTRRCTRTYSSASRSAGSAVGGQRGAARPAGNARAAHLSRPEVAATRLRRQGHLGRCFAAPRCLAATRAAAAAARGAPNLKKIEPAAAMKTAVTAPPMVAVLAAVPEMLCCSVSNIWEQ